MQITKFLPITAIALLIAYACKKEEVEDKIDNTITNTAFALYTQTDTAGVTNGTIDPSDWTFDDQWNAQERSLFPGYDTLVHFRDLNSAISPLYPNPVGQTASLLYTKFADAEVRTVMVNADYNKLFYHDSVFTNNLTINFSNLSLTSGTNYRLYYMYVRNDTCFYKGHGDLKKQ